MPDTNSDGTSLDEENLYQRIDDLSEKLNEYISSQVVTINIEVPGAETNLYQISLSSLDVKFIVVNSIIKERTVSPDGRKEKYIEEVSLGMLLSTELIFENYEFKLSDILVTKVIHEIDSMTTDFLKKMNIRLDGWTRPVSLFYDTYLRNGENPNIQIVHRSGVGPGSPLHYEDSKKFGLEYTNETPEA